MAISTLDAAGAGMQPPRHWVKAALNTPVIGIPRTAWALAGAPGAGAYDTTLNGVALAGNAVAGQMPRNNPASGFAYLGRFSGLSNTPGMLLLCDRLWHNGGFTITSTTAQSITSPAFPARDVAGSTNGDGVQLALEVSAAAGAAAPIITVGYTNQAGTAGRTATNVDATAASPSAQSTYRLGLQAGDTGVRSVQSLTLSASWVSGTINLVAYRPIASLELQGGVPNALDWLTGGAPRLFDNTVPYFMWVPGAAVAAQLCGTYVETQG